MRQSVGQSVGSVVVLCLPLRSAHHLPYVAKHGSGKREGASSCRRHSVKVLRMPHALDSAKPQGRLKAEG